MKLTAVNYDPFAQGAPSTSGPRLTPVDYDPFAEKPSKISRAFEALRIPESVKPAYNALEDVGQVYPALEAGANLATQAFAMPVAGLSGIGAAAAKAFGLSDRDPTDVIHSVGDALTYQPKTARGQRLTGQVLYPFEKLAEAGNVVGENVAELPVVPEGGATGRGATGLRGSPALGAAANALTQVAGPPAVFKGTGIAGQRIAEMPGWAAKTLGETRTAKPNVGGTNPAQTPEALDRNLPQGVTPDVVGAGRVPSGIVDIARPSGFVDSIGEAPIAARIPPTPETKSEVVQPSEQARQMRELPAEQLPKYLDRFVYGKPVGAVVPDVTFVLGELSSGGVAKVASFIEGFGEQHRRVRISGRALKHADERRHAFVEQIFPQLPEIVSNPQEVLHNPRRPNSAFIVHRMDPNALVVIEIERNGNATDVVNVIATRDKNLERFRRKSEAWQEGRRPPLILTADGGVPGGEISAVQPSAGASVRPKGDRDLVQTKPAGISGEHQALQPDDSLQPAAGSGEKIAQQALGRPGRSAPKTEASASEPSPKALPGSKPTIDEPPEQIESRASAEPPQVNSFAPGASYVGFINDNTPPLPGAGGASALPAGASARPSPKATTAPIRREDILRPFLKALGVPLYEGRVKRAGVMGFYRPKSEAVRIKNKSDLETAAHELAHLIDDRVFNGFRADKARPKSRPWEKGPNHQVYGKELRGVSYDGTKTYEGFAEFVRLWMTQHDEALARAPEFSQWFEDFTQKHEYGPALREATAGMQAWYDQGALARGASKIGEQAPLTDVMDTWRDRARQSVFDDLHGIYKMEADLKGNTDSLGAYRIARLSRAAHSIVDGALTLGAPKALLDGSHKFVGKSLEQVLEPIARDLDNWTLYAAGRSAKELFLQGREHLFTRNEIAAMVSLETPEFRKAFDDYQAWNKAVVDFAQAKGIINPETRKLWQRAEYLPFYRAGQGAPTKRAGGVEGNWNGIKRLTGGTGNVRSVLGNMIQNASQLMVEALKNEARVKVANMADTLKGGGRFMTKIHKDNRATTIDRAQIRKFVAEMLGVDEAALKPGGAKAVPPELINTIDRLTTEFEQQPDYIKFWLHNQAPRGDNIVAVMRGGKPDFYEVADPMLMRALQGLNRPGKNMVVQFLGWFRRVGQASITLTPDFMAANIARDTLMAGTMSRHGFRPVLDSIAGMKSRITKDENYREFIANGGGLASHLLDEQAFKGHLERFYTKKGINYHTVLNTPSKLLYALETLADATELSTRLGEFKRARQQGASPREAAYQAREVSTDFAMRGDNSSVGVMYDTVIFLKAAMNSLDRLYRGIAKDPQRAQIAAKTGILAAASMWLYNINRDNPAYQDLDDWDKDTHWHFFVPKADAADDAPPEERYHHFRYPKIWEIGAIASLAERSFGALLEDDKHGASLGKDFARILGNLFHLNVIPQAVKPLNDQLRNRQWPDRPIETQGMESMAKWARAAPTTNRALTEAGIASRDLPAPLQVNPVRTEALLRGYFNTWALYGLSLSDAALFDDKPTMRVDDYPVIKKFYAGTPAKRTRYETEFYDLLTEVTELRRTMTQMGKVGREEVAAELSVKPMQDEYKFLTKMNTRLQNTSKERRAVYTDDTLNSDQKRERLDGLMRERNAFLKDVVTGVQERKALRNEP